MPQLVRQSTQASGGVIPQPVFPWQPTMRVYTAKGLGFSPLDLQYQNLPVVPQLEMSILAPVGIMVSKDLTIATPIYTLLLQVS